MASGDALDRDLNLRPAIVLFLGEDTFATSEIYCSGLGTQVSAQRVLSLSSKADLSEWKELLEEAFQLFTAVSMLRLLNAGLIVNVQVQAVPVLIVTRGETERYAELISIVVECAETQNLADKLQILTVTDVVREAELRAKSAKLHQAVEAVTRTVVKLQNGVLAISDHWQGARIGSEEQTNLALARIALLLTLTEYNLEESHLGFLENGVLGGRTFWVGLGSYSADRIDLCATLIYADLLQKAIGHLLSKNPMSIVGDLGNEAYGLVLQNVSKHIGQITSSDREAASTVANYESEVVPKILEAVCSKVRSQSEVLLVLEHLARQLRITNTISNASGTVALATLLFISPEGAGIGLLGVIGVAGLFWYVIRQIQKRRPVDDAMTVSAADPIGATPNSVPYDPILADVLDDLRRELIAKLQSSPANDAKLNFLQGAPDGVLVGEKRFSFAKMWASELARSAGKSVLDVAPHRLLLLALESGKWRTVIECNELVSVQKEACRAIASALRKEFTDWAVAQEEQRVCDKSFVQEVLYASPPPSGAAISAVCVGPCEWHIPELPVPIDRSLLTNCFHFMYLVEANVPN